jgi:hypothetical protein
MFEKPCADKFPLMLMGGGWPFQVGADIGASAPGEIYLILLAFLIK